MVLDELEQQHLDEYYGFLEELQYVENNTNLSQKDFDHAMEYKIEVVDSLIQKLEEKKNESTE